MENLNSHVGVTACLRRSKFGRLRRPVRRLAEAKPRTPKQSYYSNKAVSRTQRRHCLVSLSDVSSDIMQGEKKLIRILPVAAGTANFPVLLLHTALNSILRKPASASLQQQTTRSAFSPVCSRRTISSAGPSCACVRVSVVPR